MTSLASVMEAVGTLTPPPWIGLISHGRSSQLRKKSLNLSKIWGTIRGDANWHYAPSCSGPAERDYDAREPTLPLSCCERPHVTGHERRQATTPPTYCSVSLFLGGRYLTLMPHGQHIPAEMNTLVAIQNVRALEDPRCVDRYQ